MAEDWEIDVLELTLDDLEVLQSCLGGMPGRDVSVATLKEILGRLVTNKTAEEIGKVPMKELNRQLEKINQEVEEMAVPKPSDAPSSPTSTGITSPSQSGSSS